MAIFLIANNTDDIRTKELRSSAARAHAARVSHHRRRIKLPTRAAKIHAVHQRSSQRLEIAGGAAVPEFMTEEDIAQCLLIQSLLHSHVHSDGLRTDPFHTMPGGKRYWPLIDYWTQVMMPSNRFVHEVVGVTNIYTTYFLDLLEDNFLFDVSMVTVIASLPLARRPTFSDTEVLQTRGKVLAALIKIMQNTTSVETMATDRNLIALAYLCTLERRLGSMQAYAVHANTLQNLVAARGGVDNLGHGGLVKARLLQWDTFWGINSGKTLFPDARRPYQPVYPSLASILRSNEYMDLPTGFVRLAIRDGLPLDVLELLVKVNTAWKWRDHVVAADNEPQISHLHKPYSDFRDAIPCLGIADGESPDFRKLLCIAVLLFCNNGLSSERGVTNLGNNCKQKLLADLPRLKLTEMGKARKECMFWMTIVTIDAWIESPSSILSSPAVRKVVEIFTAIGSEWSSFEKQQAMEDFFYGKLLSKTLHYLIRATQVDKSVLSEK